MRKTQKEMRFSQCIALIDGLLVGLLDIWDIPLDAASFIALTMAIGFSVGAETVFSVRPLSVVTRSVYQDRLGTNTGKTLTHRLFMQTLPATSPMPSCTATGTCRPGSTPPCRRWGSRCLKAVSRRCSACSSWHSRCVSRFRKRGRPRRWMICVVFIRCLSRACLAKSIVFRSDDTMKSSQIPEHVLVQFLHPGRARPRSGSSSSCCSALSCSACCTGWSFSRPFCDSSEGLSGRRRAARNPALKAGLVVVVVAVKSRRRATHRMGSGCTMERRRRRRRERQRTTVEAPG